MTAPNAPAPAAMVGEEEVARVIAEANLWDRAWFSMPEPEKAHHRAAAKEVLALFAPLAQKVERLRGENRELRMQALADEGQAREAIVQAGVHQNDADY